MTTTQPDTCLCGKTLARFRTGLTYADVYSMLWVAGDDYTTFRRKGRRQVLGKWHEIKLAMWASHVAECSHHESQDPEAFAAYYGTPCAPAMHAEDSVAA